MEPTRAVLGMCTCQPMHGCVCCCCRHSEGCCGCSAAAAAAAAGGQIGPAGAGGRGRGGRQDAPAARHPHLVAEELGVRLGGRHDGAERLVKGPGEVVASRRPCVWGGGGACHGIPHLITHKQLRQQGKHCSGAPAPCCAPKAHDVPSCHPRCFKAPRTRVLCAGRGRRGPARCRRCSSSRQAVSRLHQARGPARWQAVTCNA